MFPLEFIVGTQFSVQDALLRACGHIAHSVPRPHAATFTAIMDQVANVQRAAAHPEQCVFMDIEDACTVEAAVSRGLYAAKLLAAFKGPVATAARDAMGPLREAQIPLARDVAKLSNGRGRTSSMAFFPWLDIVVVHDVVEGLFRDPKLVPGVTVRALLCAMVLADAYHTLWNGGKTDVHARALFRPDQYERVQRLGWTLPVEYAAVLQVVVRGRPLPEDDTYAALNAFWARLKSQVEPVWHLQEYARPPPPPPSSFLYQPALGELAS